MTNEPSEKPGVTDKPPTTSDYEPPDLRDWQRRRSPSEPANSYRPESSEFEEEQRRRSSGTPWGGRDIVGAIGLSITGTAVVGFAGLLVDAMVGSEDTSLPGAAIAIVVATALSLGIVFATRLPVTSTVNVIGLLTAANVVIHVASDGGENQLFGLSASFMEVAVQAGVPFGVAWLYVNRKYRRSLTELGLVSPKSPTAYAIAAGAWFVAVVGVGLWSQLVSDIDTVSPPDNATPLLEIAGGSLAVAWVLVGLWGPAVEEIFFRGFLLGGLRARLGDWPALLVSSGVFALFHVDPGLYVPTAMLGLAFGWVYLKTRSLWPAIFAHTAHNTLALVAAWQDLG